MSQTAKFEETLRWLAAIDDDFVGDEVGLRIDSATTSLDPKTAALLRVGASVALGSPGVCLEWSTGRALAAGASEEEAGPALAREEGMATCDQRVGNWTVVLRRQPARIVEGRPEGGYTDMFELICCDCGDDPDLDYREVSPKLQLVRGPYPIAAGVAAYTQHVKLHQPRSATGRSR
jgi:alkylhydroperoxidase/carboxymuconolactone decarboxylase family protein YurZ